MSLYSLSSQIQTAFQAQIHNKGDQQIQTAFAFLFITSSVENYINSTDIIDEKGKE